MAQPYSSQKIWLNLSSTDRTSGTNNDFTIQFNSGALTNEAAGYFGSKSYINPVFFSLPNNWQNIQANYNNVFYLSGNLFPDGGVILLLDPGVYQSVPILCTYLQAKIRAAMAAVTYTGVIQVSQSTTQDLSFNYINIKWSTPPASTENVSFYFNSGTPVLLRTNPQNFSTIIGCEDNIITLNPTTISYTLTQLPNLALYDMIQIECSLCRSTYEIQSGQLSPSIIMVSFPTANYLTANQVVFLNNNPFLYRQEMRTPNWDTINIRITDKGGRLIPYFGELDLSITIEREQYNEPQNLARIKDQNPWTADMFYK